MPIAAMPKRTKRKTRIQRELERGRKPLFGYIKSELRDWLDRRCEKERRDLQVEIELLIERERDREKATK